MRKSLALLAVTLLFAACATSGDVPRTNRSGSSFNAFYAKLKTEARARGYDPAQLDAAFSGRPAPIAAVLQAEKTQPESVRSFAQYTGSMLSADRISRGTANLAGHRAALGAIQSATGVSASVVVALWGIETNFGKVQGQHPVIPALVTLAWQSPRSDYFRKETFNALEVLKRTGRRPENLLGSWAGAMGQCQFMPGSYLAYATDGDGDGKADIWNTEDDVFASAATYLQKRGWNPATPWRVAAGEIDTRGLGLNTRGLSEPMPVSAWEKRGFDNRAKLRRNLAFRYYRPQEGGPAYLLGPNFSVILSWNNSSYFAWSVLALADTIEQEANR